MIKMVVFDMAGTTINEDNTVYKTVRKALESAGFKFTLEEVFAEGAGKEKQQAIRSILKTYAQIEDEEIVSEVYIRFVQELRTAYEEQSMLPQENAVSVLKLLKENGIYVVLNTGYNSETAQMILNKIGWQKGIEYDALITASDVAKNRPDPDMILLARQMFNIETPLQIAKVGDSIIDIEEGKNADCGLTIGITTGAHTREQLRSANPDYIINNLSELPEILNVGQLSA